VKNKVKPCSASFLALFLLLSIQALAQPDPGARGPRAGTRQEYNFGATAFQPTDWVPLPGSPRVEVTASVHHPTDLSDGPFPLVVFLHGRHATCFAGGAAFLQWPCTPPRQPIPSYQGYDYIAEVLASHGYIVVSISANGINARDNSVFDLGMLARAELIQHHLNIWRTFNTTGGPPFGTLFVGKLDLNNVGTMGHSRGGEGVVRHFVFNASQGSPHGIQAVFPLAPVDFSRPVINNVPLAVLLPYCDGDVADLQGVHFYDDARYNVPADAAAKHTLLVQGGNHNFYNTIWTPSLFPAGTFDDWLIRDPALLDTHCGAVPGNRRLTPAQQRGTGLAYIAGFFRLYLGGESHFLSLFTGDAAAPPSAMTNDLLVSYHPPDDPRFRRDVNRLLDAINLTMNTLGGVVAQSGLTPYDLCGGEEPQPRHCLPTPPQPTSRQPHTTPSARAPARRGLSQNRFGWNDTTARLENQLPDGFRDLSGFYALQFRASVNFLDPRNAVGMPRDLAVTLVDGAGNSATTPVSNWSKALFYPPGRLTPLTPVPKIFLDTVRIPLAAFAGINLTDVRSVRFNFSQTLQGALLISDVAFADEASLYVGPFVVSSTPSGRLFGPVSSVQVAFNTPIDAATFTPDDIVSFEGPPRRIRVRSVSVVPDSNNARFEIAFAPQTETGVYTMVIGPDIRDANGNPMDQNFNRVAGEDPDDRFTATFGLLGPRIVASAPMGIVLGPVSSARVAFNTSMFVPSFHKNDVDLTGPAGEIRVRDVDVVPGSGDRQFDITFDPQSRAGSYTMVINPNVRDLFRNRMDQNDNLVPGEVPGDQFVTTFNVDCSDVDGFGYQACDHGFEAIDLETGQPGVFTLITAADDAAVAVNLGGNTFNFYGVTYTGAGRLIVSSNGLITFDGTDTPFDFDNQDLTTTPRFAAIAPLWDDLWKENGTAANPMVLGKFEDLNSDGTADRLIIEWNQVFHFDARTNPETLQAILELNTGAVPGSVTFNYVDLDLSQPGLNNGASATIGMKDSGTQGPRRLLVSFNSPSMLVESGRAIRITHP